jgi:serine/threonine protein kinase
MRATKNVLPEQFIIPVARELAKGLRAIHEAGIIHRDVKGTTPPAPMFPRWLKIYLMLTLAQSFAAANVLIHEEGNLQICDFGVAGILQTQIDKRSTWIGTPHWMPPEFFPQSLPRPDKPGAEPALEYSSEVCPRQTYQSIEFAGTNGQCAP